MNFSYVTEQGHRLVSTVPILDRFPHKILGKNTTEIAEILGYDYGLPVIHRDNLVLNKT